MINDWYGTSCLLAVVLMDSSIQRGNLRDIDWVVGFKFVKLTLLALDQSNRDQGEYSLSIELQNCANGANPFT